MCIYKVLNERMKITSVLLKEIQKDFLNEFTCIRCERQPIKKIYSAFLLSSSRGGLVLSTENGESSSFPPLVESTKNGIPEEFLLRRAQQLLLKWSTPFVHQKRMVLLISSSCGESSSFPPFKENSPKEELRRNSF